VPTSLFNGDRKLKKIEERINKLIETVENRIDDLENAENMTDKMEAKLIAMQDVKESLDEAIGYIEELS